MCRPQVISWKGKGAPDHLHQAGAAEAVMEQLQEVGVAARYPQVPGAADFEPVGKGGLVAAHRAQILGLERPGVLRCGRPLALGPRWELVTQGDC